MFNQSIVYDIIYSLAANDGREDKLFGNCAKLARDCFARSMTCDTFPEIWFEIPLAGDPWFDLHLLTSREALGPDSRFDATNTGGHPDAFAWFARQNGVRQLALSWDVSAGDITAPAIQVLMSHNDPGISCGFLQANGRDDLQDAYRAFVGRIPQGWFACYTGVFPGRQHDFVRVECVVDEDLQQGYAKDASLLENHLRQAGVREFGDTLIERCQELARSPFHLEFQFDVISDGSTGPTLGASVRFAAPPGEGDWPFFDPSQQAGELMNQVEEWELADERWRLLASTTFATRMSRAGDSALLFCYPAFLKLLMPWQASW